MNVTERFSRQASVINRDTLVGNRVTVVGNGAIGRNVSIQLASIGVQNLQLIDFDTVEESNVASQGFPEIDIGLSKVAAVAKTCKSINNTIEIEELNHRFRRSVETGNIIFCCVDSMKARKLVFEATRRDASFFVDGRMAAEALEVYKVTGESEEKKYTETLFTDAEAYQGTCTAKTTLYCASMAAGVMVSKYTKWLRHIPDSFMLSYNILADEMEKSF